MHKDCMQYVIKITPECTDTIETWSYNFKLVIMEVIEEHDL